MKTEGELSKDKYGAPERIFLQLHGDQEPEGFVSCEDDISWCWHAIWEHDVEYVRLDLFQASEKKVGELEADAYQPVCDQLGCDSLVTCGTPTPTGYRNTCYNHKPKEPYENRR